MVSEQDLEREQKFKTDLAEYLDTQSVLDILKLIDPVLEFQSLHKGKACYHGNLPLTLNTYKIVMYVGCASYEDAYNLDVKKGMKLSELLDLHYLLQVNFGMFLVFKHEDSCI